MSSILYIIFIICLITLFSYINAEDNIDAKWLSYLTNNDMIVELMI